MVELRRAYAVGGARFRKNSGPPQCIHKAELLDDATSSLTGLTSQAEKKATRTQIRTSLLESALRKMAPKLILACHNSTDSIIYNLQILLKEKK